MKTMRCPFILTLFQGLILWFCLLFHAVYSAWGASFWLLEACLLLAPSPGLLIMNFEEVPGWAAQWGAGRPRGCSYLRDAPSRGAGWVPPVPAQHPEKEEESISLFFLFPFLPLRREPALRVSYETRQCGRNILENTCFMYNCSVSSLERLNTALLSRILTRNIPSALRLGEGGGGGGCEGWGGMGLDLTWWCSSYWKPCCPCSAHPFPSWRLSVPPLPGSRAPTLSHSGPPSLWNHKALQPNLKQVCFLSLPMHLSSWVSSWTWKNISSSPHLLTMCQTCLLAPFTDQGSWPSQTKLPVLQLTALAQPARQSQSPSGHSVSSWDTEKLITCSLLGTCLSPVLGPHIGWTLAIIY